MEISLAKTITSIALIFTVSMSHYFLPYLDKYLQLLLGRYRLLKVLYLAKKRMGKKTIKYKEQVFLSLSLKKTN